MTSRYWAGFTNRTHPFGLAIGYVFSKQSASPGHCDLPFRKAGTPYRKLTGLICRFPWPGTSRHALGYSPRGTCVGSRYGHPRFQFLTSFSWTPGIRRTRHNGKPLLVSPTSRHYGSPWVLPVRQSDNSARRIQKCRKPSVALRQVLGRHGNINPFPFRTPRVKEVLRTG